MSPTLALLLCTVFVLFLLRLDRKQAPKVSIILWIPTIWMLCISTKPLGIWFGVEADAGGSPLDRVFLSGLLCLSLFILARRKFGWYRTIKKHTWLMLLICYMFVSILWSDIPFTSFKRWIKELIAVVMAFLVLIERDPRQAVQSLFRRTIYILIPFSILLIKYFPEYGVAFARWSGERTWIGVTQQKNGLGRLCIIAAFFLIWTLVRRWHGRDIPVGKCQTYAEVFVLIITLWLLLGPPGVYPATAVVALTAGLGTFIGLLWMKKYRIIIEANMLATIIALVIGFGVITLMVGGSSVAGVTSTLGRDSTLTGRTKIWAELLPIVEREPVLGCGFGGFWTHKTREVYDTSDAHSGYLEVLLELGFVGILLLAMFLMAFCRKAQREMTYDFDWASLCICYLIMALVHNITESSINSFTSHLTAVLLFLAVSSRIELVKKRQF